MKDLFGQEIKADIRNMTRAFRALPPGWPFDPLPMFGFDFAMVDPAWRFLSYDGGRSMNHKSPEAQYDTMLLSQIEKLPIGDLFGDGGILWLWCTSPMIDQQIACLKKWGFRFCTSGGWMKRTRNGEMRWGTGYRLRSTMEPYALGIIGNPKSSRGIPNGFDGLARKHSQKPEEAYRWAEKMMPAARRCEIFSRTERKDWSTWGDEAGLFGEAA